MNINKTTFITFTILLVLLSAAAYLVWFSPSAKERKISALPDDNFNKVSQSLELTDLNGTPVALKDFRGSTLVVNSWASWCPFCIQELPDFERLSQEFADANVKVLAVNRAESKVQIESYLRTLQSFESMLILQDTNDTLYRAMGGFSMPETVFYDTTGNVVFHKRGFMNYEEMKIHLNQALNTEVE